MTKKVDSGDDDGLEIDEAVELDAADASDDIEIDAGDLDGVDGEAELADAGDAEPVAEDEAGLEVAEETDPDATGALPDVAADGDAGLDAFEEEADEIFGDGVAADATAEGADNATPVATILPPEVVSSRSRAPQDASEPMVEIVNEDGETVAVSQVLPREFLVNAEEMEAAKKKKKGVVSLRRTTAGASRRGGGRRGQVELTPEQLEKMRKADAKAKLIIYGAIGLFTLAFLVLVSYRLPWLVKIVAKKDIDPIWPWSVLCPPPVDDEGESDSLSSQRAALRPDPQPAADGGETDAAGENAEEGSADAAEASGDADDAPAAGAEGEKDDGEAAEEKKEAEEPAEDKKADTEKGADTEKDVEAE